MPVVKSISKAFLVILAGGAWPFPGPASIPERFEFGLPYILKIVLVYIALDKGSVYAGCCFSFTFYYAFAW